MENVTQYPWVTALFRNPPTIANSFSTVCQLSVTFIQYFLQRMSLRVVFIQPSLTSVMLNTCITRGPRARQLAYRNTQRSLALEGAATVHTHTRLLPWLFLNLTLSPIFRPCCSIQRECLVIYHYLLTCSLYVVCQVILPCLSSTLVSCCCF